MQQNINTLLDPVVNFGKVTVFTGYTNVDTVIVLTLGQGAKLPNPSIDGQFNLVWYNSSKYADASDDPNVEIVRCTTGAGDVLTVIRGQEGIPASSKNSSGDTYNMILSSTKKTISDIQTDAQSKVNTHAAVTTSVHNFDASGDAPAQTHNNTRHSETYLTSADNIIARSLKSATTTIDISGATAPSTNQVLTATSSTTANWQNLPSLSSPNRAVYTKTVADGLYTLPTTGYLERFTITRSAGTTGWESNYDGARLTLTWEDLTTTNIDVSGSGSMNGTFVSTFELPQILTTYPLKRVAKMQVFHIAQYRGGETSTIWVR